MFKVGKLGKAGKCTIIMTDDFSKEMDYKLQSGFITEKHAYDNCIINCSTWKGTPI